MANEIIKMEIKASGLYQWQVADKMGIADVTLSRKMRKELPESEKKIIREIIQANKNSFEQKK